MPPETLGILLMSGGHERAHYAFMTAAAAGAIGRAVVLFATNEGCRALTRAGVQGMGRDDAVRAAGVAGLEELREGMAALGVRVMACDSGLRMAGIGADALLEGVEVSGLPTFLSAVGQGVVVTL